jgi:putative transcriptional regulator
MNPVTTGGPTTTTTVVSTSTTNLGGLPGVPTMPPRCCRPPDAALTMRNRLRELRAIHRWSQADLADLLGVSRQTVNAIETERFDPSLPLAFTIAEIFDRSIEDIFVPDRETDVEP